jgi:hypothetical protein
MDVPTQISDYLAAQPGRKRREMQALHDIILGLLDCRLWFLDGKDERGRLAHTPP